MLKLVWTPGAAAPPDDEHYRRAVDTLSAEYGVARATAGLPRDPAQTDTGLDAVANVVRAWLDTRSVPNAAVKLMLHGFDHDPRHEGDSNFDPFAVVYGYPGENGLNGRLSWLPLVGECDADGGHRQQTAIGFAWTSTGTLAEYASAMWGDSYEYACIDLAPLAARALAALLEILGAARVRVDVLAHSLGTRLFTKAVAVLGREDGMLNNVVLLDGAEFSIDAAATFAGRRFGVVNITNDVDSVLALGAEQLGDPSRPPHSIEACSIGRHGLGTPAQWEGKAEYPLNWVDIALDRRDVQAWFRANGGYDLSPTASDSLHDLAAMNHWACYTEPGNRRWVTDLLWQPRLSAAALGQEEGLPRGVRGLQPVFAGLGIPTKTPMTAAARLAIER